MKTFGNWFKKKDDYDIIVTIEYPEYAEKYIGLLIEKFALDSLSVNIDCEQIKGHKVMMRVDKDRWFELQTYLDPQLIIEWKSWRAKKIK